MKEIVKSSAIGIGMATFIFCTVCVVFDIIHGGSFSSNHYEFTKMILGCLLVGIGFGAPSIVYQNENIPRPIQVVIHMGIGCIVYTIVAYTVGWIPTELSVWKWLSILAAQIMVAFVMWLILMKHFKDEARRINERIQEME